MELTLDIMNVANLLNKDWGRTFSSGYNSEFVSPITYKGDGVFQFANPSDMPLKYPSSYYSRWRGQVWFGSIHSKVYYESRLTKILYKQ